MPAPKLTLKPHVVFDEIDLPSDKKADRGKIIPQVNYLEDDNGRQGRNGAVAGKEAGRPNHKDQR